MAIQQSTTTPTIQHIPFHEDQLYAIVDERTGIEYVLPKPMADMFGLGWRAQLAKLTKNRMFAKGTLKISLPSAGGDQETVILERRLVHAWLFSIDINRVAPEHQAKLLRYQEECASVLDAYFTQSVPVLPATRGDLLVQMAEAYRVQEKRLLEIEEQQHQQILATIETQRQAIQALSASTRAETKADMALDDAHRMTLENYIMRNGLLRQFPRSQWPAYAKWLADFCQEYDMKTPKVPVYGKPWPDEKSYPLDALAAWVRHELHKPRQVALVLCEEG